MASNTAYLDFVLDQLSGVDGISFRRMMGEYVLYCRGKVFGGIYDDRFLVKPTPAALRKMPDAPRELPYAGAKEMLMVEQVDDRAFLAELVEAMEKNLGTGEIRDSRKSGPSRSLGKTGRGKKELQNV